MPRPESIPPDVDAAIQAGLNGWMDENVYADQDAFDSHANIIGLIEEAYEAGYLQALDDPAGEVT